MIVNYVLLKRKYNKMKYNNISLCQMLKENHLKENI
jgi:hypothetical protein